jgi:hypothetical protein
MLACSGIGKPVPAAPERSRALRAAGTSVRHLACICPTTTTHPRRRLIPWRLPSPPGNGDSHCVLGGTSGDRCSDSRLRREIALPRSQLRTPFPSASHSGDRALRPPRRATRFFRVAEDARCARPVAAGPRATPVPASSTRSQAPHSRSGPLSSPHRRLDAAERLRSAGRSTGLNGLRATRPGSGVPGGLDARLCSLPLTPGRRRWGGVRPVWAPLNAPPPTPRCRSARAPPGAAFGGNLGRTVADQRPIPAGAGFWLPGNDVGQNWYAARSLSTIELNLSMEDRRCRRLSSRKTKPKR